MKICAIICEFNPFHNGHSYLINKIREKGYTHIVCIMSGNFIQRASPAIIPKEVRTKQALLCGADLVIELPVIFSTATADKFAFGGIEIIKNMNCIDAIAFGAENENIDDLIAINEIISSTEFSAILKDNLKKGLNFATSRHNAIEKINPNLSINITTPNNILAIEYLKHLDKSNINAIPILRKSVNHNDKNTVEEYSSASFIRDNDLKSIEKFMPEKSFELYKKAFDNGEFLDYNKFEIIMLSSLRQKNIEFLKTLPNISEGIENKIYNAINSSTTLDELYDMAKSKRYSHSRIRRIALSALLGITNDIITEKPPYIRILGMNKNGEEILSEIKKNSDIPISHSLTKLAKENILSKKFADTENNSTNLYNLMLKIPKKSNTDLTFSPIKI